MIQLRNTCLALCTACLLAACGGKDKKETKPEDAGKPEVKNEAPATNSKLNGAWEIKRAEGIMAETNVGTVYEFDGNKLSFGKDGYKNPGTTIVTDTTFTFQANGNELKFAYNYKMKGDTLVVEMQNSNGQIFYMVKQ
jgi:hypothetical protein